MQIGGCAKGLLLQPINMQLFVGIICVCIKLGAWPVFTKCMEGVDIDTLNSSPLCGSLCEWPHLANILFEVMQKEKEKEKEALFVGAFGLFAMAGYF